MAGPKARNGKAHHPHQAKENLRPGRAEGKRERQKGDRETNKKSSGGGGFAQQRHRWLPPLAPVMTAHLEG